MTSAISPSPRALLALIEEDLLRSHADVSVQHLLNQPTMFETALYVGSKIRRVAEMDRAALERDGLSFNINVLVGCDIFRLPPQIHYVYSQGNSWQANVESPFLQIGEYKYGKPILDRGFNYEMTLSEAVKFAILSMEATVKSNVSVGGPFDIFADERDSLEVKLRRRSEESDYFRDIKRRGAKGS